MEQTFEMSFLHVVFWQCRTREETYMRNLKEVGLVLDSTIGSGVLIK